MCLMHLYLFFSTMSSFVDLYSLYVHMFKLYYLYLYVYCQCLMLTVCTKGLRVTQFQLSVCAVQLAELTIKQTLTLFTLSANFRKNTVQSCVCILCMCLTLC